jgi:hypothetical protein
MSKLRVPALPDFLRVIGRDAHETEAKLYYYYANQQAASFNYVRASSLSRFAFEHNVALDQILDACEQEKTKQGKKSNADVLRLLWDSAAGRSVRTYKMGPKYLAIRRDLKIRVAPAFYFVEDGKANEFWLQPRKTYALDHFALALLASIVKATFLVDDFESVGFEVCDMSAPTPRDERKLTTYSLNSFRIMDEQELAEKFQFFASAYDRLVARGVKHSERITRRPPPAEPDLFA